MTKPALCFFTNQPTPYQLDFFDALSEYFTLHVIYFSTIESDRHWVLADKSTHYQTTVLNDGLFARIIQRAVPSFHFTWKIFSVCKNNRAKFVVVNGTYWTPNVVLCLLLSKLRKKIVAFWSEPVFEVKNRFYFWLKYLLLFPVRRWSDMLLAIGKNARKSFLRYGYRKNIYDVPYNIDISLFDKANIDKKRLNDLAKAYKNNGETIILTSGSLIHRKGIDIVIRAFQRLEPELNVRLIITGEGQDRSYLQELAKKDPRINFLGFQEKQSLPYIYNISDIFVCASRYDGWALVINEALASCIPIVSSDMVGAVHDLLQDGINVMVCKSEQVDCFESAMRMLIVDEDFRKQLVFNSGKAINACSSHYNAKKLFDILRPYE